MPTGTPDSLSGPDLAIVPGSGPTAWPVEYLELMAGPFGPIRVAYPGADRGLQGGTGPLASGIGVEPARGLRVVLVPAGDDAQLRGAGLAGMSRP